VFSDLLTHARKHSGTFRTNQHGRRCYGRHSTVEICAPNGPKFIHKPVRNTHVDYQLVFDAVRHGYTTWRAAILPACIAMVATLLSVLVRSESPSQERESARRYRALTGLVGALAGLGCVAMLAHTWRDYAKLRTALRNGTYLLVEGRVTDFVPERRDGHPIEMFRVGDAQFEYSTSDITSAFHWTAGQGGPIRDGVSVRIADVDGAIARLEIGR
jgi:hypothetical protein